jgi:hypothetical protein
MEFKKEFFCVSETLRSGGLWGSLLFADRIELRPVFNTDFSAVAHGMESPD